MFTLSRRNIQKKGIAWFRNSRNMFRNSDNAIKDNSQIRSRMNR